MASISDTAKKRKQRIDESVKSGSRGPFMPHTEIRVRHYGSMDEDRSTANYNRQLEEATGVHRSGAFGMSESSMSAPVIRKRKRS